MSKEKITLMGDSPALPIPDDILQSAGLKVGDELEITVRQGVVTLRPVEEQGRQERLEAATENVFHRRRDAYKRLA